MQEKAAWIWRDAARNGIHEVLWFRREFDASADPEAMLEIAADTDFVVWLNGIEVGRGQYPNFPSQRTFQRFAAGAALKAGANEIRVQVYHAGEGFFSIVNAPAGLWARVVAQGQTVCATDGAWEWAFDPFHRSENPVKVTGQLGFAFDSDLSRPAQWNFRPVTVADDPAPALPRPVASLVLEEAIVPAVTAQGDLMRPADAADAGGDFLRFKAPGNFFAGYDTEYPAQLQWPLRFAMKGGAYFICDLGAETVGLLSLRLRAPEGTRIDILHGEHLLDGRVRARIGGRSFIDHLVVGAGAVEYELPFRRFGARYLEFHFIGSGEVTIEQATLIPTEYPLPEAAPFTSGDRALNRLDEVCVRTLELCMHDHYEDCPWREQGLYAYDTRNQTLYGYSVWGNYDYAAASLRLLGHGVLPSGWIGLCAPAEIPLTIPVFSFAWIGSLADHAQHSGSDGLRREFSGTLDRMFGRYLELFDAQDAVMRLPEDADLWHFYEWLPGESCADEAANPVVGPQPERHAAFNLYFLEVLRYYAEWKNDPALRDMARQLAAGIHRLFFDPARCEYRTGTKGGVHLHTQILALYCGIVPEQERTRLTARILNDEFGEITYSAMPYLVKSLMPLSPEARRFTDELVCRSYGAAVEAGATSMWETGLGAADFAGAGSLCHGWSSLPAYYFRGWVLGIRPLDAGFRRFTVAPYPGRLSEASGETMTPAGPIAVQWRRTPEGIVGTVRYPAGLTPELQPYPEFPVAHMELIPQK